MRGFFEIKNDDYSELIVWIYEYKMVCYVYVRKFSYIRVE